MPVFRGFHPSSFSGTLYAYIKATKNKNFLKIKEKESFTNKPQQEYASCGIYYFKSLELYKYFANKLLSDTKGEAYVSLIYNYMKNEKLKINIYEVENLFVWELHLIICTTYSGTNILKVIFFFKSKLDSNTNNLIPMSGRGDRFKKYGYRVPKPLIQINKFSMLELATNTFPRPKKWNFIINEKIIKIKE